jgi:hypothetical protein
LEGLILSRWLDGVILSRLLKGVILSEAIRAFTSYGVEEPALSLSKGLQFPSSTHNVKGS